MLVQRQCQAEEIAARSEFQQGKLYQPKESYAVGEQVVFRSWILLWVRSNQSARAITLFMVILP